MGHISYLLEISPAFSLCVSESSDELRFVWKNIFIFGNLQVFLYSHGIYNVKCW
jgi:hypothetical protein